MNSKAINDLEFLQVKAISVAVSDVERANLFYKETLGLSPDNIRNIENAFMIGEVLLLLKPQEEWYGKPTDELNARITLEVNDAYATEKALLQQGVTISDPVAVYGDNPIGAFLDSEGNKPLVLFRLREKLNRAAFARYPFEISEPRQTQFPDQTQRRSLASA